MCHDTSNSASRSTSEAVAGCDPPASITLLSREANPHGRDARATWHGHLAHAVESERSNGGTPASPALRATGQKDQNRI